MKFVEIKNQKKNLNFVEIKSNYKSYNLFNRPGVARAVLQTPL